METTAHSTSAKNNPRAGKEEQYKKYIKWIWRLAVAGLSVMVLWFAYLSLFAKLPGFEELENPQTNLASEVLSDDGSTLGRFFIENRVPVTYEQLSPHLVDALIATEDERFLEHAGVDPEALARVAVKTVLGGDSSSGGGSTITQQLAKLLYGRTSTRGMNFVQRAWTMLNVKFKEWITSVRLERSYTKQEIMAMYLNKYDFLNGAYGIKAASEIYFGKSQDSLNIQESAMLIGMLKNSSYYNPNRRPELVKQRREVVMSQMVKAEMLEKTLYDSLRQTELGLSFKRSTHSEGPAPYCREEIRKEVKNIFADMQRLDGVERNVHTDGYKIYTTINPKMQEHAEFAARKHLKSLQKTFFKRWGKKDPWTYGATKSEIEARKNAFNRVVKESERYGEIREKQLKSVLDAIKETFDFTIQDFDIERMLNQEEDDTYLAGLREKKLLTKKKSTLYRKIMKSDEWTKLKNRWTAFQAAVNKEFSTEVPMKVFAYNPVGEIDTLMTPFDSIRYHRMHLQCGVIAVEPQTGHIKAWVGGPDHKYFKFDHVNKSVSRQVGSTFKPFVYAAAVEMRGISPCFTVMDQPVTIHAGEAEFGLVKDWTPKNFSKYTGNKYTLQEGLRQSKNTVSAYLMKELRSVDPVRTIVKNMGIEVDQEILPGEYRVPKQPSIALGATNLSVYEMTGAFATFANNGIYNSPVLIKRIEDRNGNVIYEAPRIEKQALSEQSNYVMIDMLQKVVQGANTVRKVKSQIAGKTGTTNKHADGWFMGLTPNLAVGTWVGGDDRWIRFISPYWGQGTRMAAPVFWEFLRQVEADPELEWDTKARFPEPMREIEIELDCSKYDQENYDDANNNDPNNPNSGAGGDTDFFEDEFGDEFDTPSTTTPPDSTGVNEYEEF